MFTRFVVLAALAALLPPALAAEPLTLDQALALAVQRSQLARAGRAGVAAAADAARAAGQLPDPVLSAGIDNLPATGPERFRTTGESMAMKRVGISQEWLSSGKRALREAAARTQVGRELATEQAALADARLQAAQAYVDAWYAGESLRLARLAEHHVHEEFEAAQGRLASAGASSQEVLAMSAARGAAEDDAAEVLQAHAAALVALERWVGSPSASLAPPQLAAAPSEQAFVEAHPAVVAARRDLEAARAEAAVTASNRHPNWTWQVSYGQRTGLPDLVSVGVSIPLPVAPAQRQDRETSARLALAEKADAALEEARRAAAAEYRALVSDAQRLAQRIERYRQGVVAPAQQRTEAALAGYRSSQVTLMALFDARHAEVDTQRKLLALRKDLAKVQAQLAFKPVPGAAE